MILRLTRDYLNIYILVCILFCFINENNSVQFCPTLSVVVCQDYAYCCQNYTNQVTFKLKFKKLLFNFQMPN